MKKIRVLQIVGDSKFGGASWIIADTASMLLDKGMNVTVLTTEPTLSNILEKRGVHVWPFQGIQRSINPFLDLLTVNKLSRQLKDKYDIVHTHTTKGGFIGRIAAYRAKVPVILHTVHGFAFHEFSPFWVTWLGTMAEHYLAKRSDGIIFVNEHDRRMAIERKIVPAQKTITIYNGVDESRFPAIFSSDKSQLLCELGLAPDTFLGVFVGRLAKQKGLRYLFSAVKKIQTDYPEFNFHLALIGDGEMKEQCMSWVVDEKIQEKIHFMGFRTDALRWTAGADVFILSSLWEGHSITLLEAMGCGQAIVATDIKGNRETITHGKNGLLVPPADSDALAEAIRTLLEDQSLRDKIKRQSKESFLSNYTIKQMLENIWSYYQVIIKSANSRM